MAKGMNQKLKLVYLIKIFMEKTDENHGITMADIIDALAAYDVTAERKSLYSDFEAIRLLGYDIVGEQVGKNYHYRLVGKPFEIAELKLLVDVIQSARFITEKKSNELIRKLEAMASSHEARQMQRQVYVTGRSKTLNEAIYYNVDAIHEALVSNRRIRFQYFQWNVKKEMELRRDGKVYEISPWALTWEDENYYLIGYDAEAGKIKHYRVDKMLKIAFLDKERQGREVFETYDMPSYTKMNFGMFGGEEQTVKLLCSNYMANVVVDRFGTDVMMIPVGEDRFRVNVKVAVSPQFLGWIFAMGGDIRIEGPAAVVAAMKEASRKIYNQYEQQEDE